jgi:hypothetical protein
VEVILTVTPDLTVQVKRRPGPVFCWQGRAFFQLNKTKFVQRDHTWSILQDRKHLDFFTEERQGIIVTVRAHDFYSGLDFFTA